MKAVVVLGSRNPEGQTARAARALVQGLSDAGVDVEQVFLPKLQIERCRQCENHGWGLCRKEGRCVIDDDFAAVARKLKEANVAVFAVPVYFSDLSESLRAFLDRLRRTCMNESGKVGIAGTPAVGICVAGGGGGGAPACCVSLEKVLSTAGFDVVDMVPVRRQNLDMKMECLPIVGKWLASQAAT